MPRWVTGIVLLLALPPTGLAYAALLGLGLHRHAAPWARVPFLRAVAGVAA